MELDPSKMYSIGDLVKGKFIPGLTNNRIASEFVVRDLKRENLLGARWVYKGQVSRLEMPGYKIKEYLKNHHVNI